MRSCDKAWEKCLAYTNELSKANILDDRMCSSIPDFGAGQGILSVSLFETAHWLRTGSGKENVDAIPDHRIIIESLRLEKTSKIITGDVNKLSWHQMDGLLPSSSGTEPVEQHKVILSDDWEEGERSRHLHLEGEVSPGVPEVKVTQTSAGLCLGILVINGFSLRDKEKKIVGTARGYMTPLGAKTLAKLSLDRLVLGESEIFLHLGKFSDSSEKPAHMGCWDGTFLSLAVPYLGRDYGTGPGTMELDLELDRFGQGLESSVHKRLDTDISRSGKQRKMKTGEFYIHQCQNVQIK
ncbi:hypothetical protein WISP_137693 [Willisornis vidua]|uniref:Uncharacterized protein n=1 Tax=Willisornis vidua TaxID=1566151 RepID=A0ABQ9CQW0_9PASS|nr:hypothetical protein WISP_137693 [Willisornis vidua]